MHGVPLATQRYILDCAKAIRYRDLLLPLAIPGVIVNQFVVSLFNEYVAIDNETHRYVSIHRLSARPQKLTFSN